MPKEKVCRGPTARYLLDLLEDDDNESKMDDMRAMTMTIKQQKKRKTMKTIPSSNQTAT